MQAVYLTTNGDTTTVLPFPIEVQNYGCGVFEISGDFALPRIGNQPNNNNTNLYLCCNLVEESIVGNIKMPVLRVIKRKRNVVATPIYNIIWLKVMRPSISSIRLYIADETGKVISLPRNKLNCTLLFVPDPTT